LGVLGFPLSFLLFGRLPDRGYAFAKPLALLLAAYVLWVLGLTGAVLNMPQTVAGILMAGAAIFGWLYYRRWFELEAFLKAHWRYIFIVEGLFLATFLAWLFIVSEAPAINHTEKPMDFAFLNGILQSATFPPGDPWLSGHSISYYYFGHFLMALPMKLAGITSNVGYNLALATLPALVAVGALGLTCNLVRLAGGSFRAGILSGLLASLLITVMGNLEGVLEFIQVRGWAGEGFWQWAGIKDLNGTAGAGLFPDTNWWWWRATRVIDTLQNGASLDYTITEFPFFSFLLGDLHSHVLALPFVLLTLALALNLYRSNEPVGFRWLLRHPWQSLALALCFGALAFINFWDFPVYAAILGAVTLAKSWSDRSALQPSRTDDIDATQSIGEGMAALRRAFVSSALSLGPILAVSMLLFLPFYIDLTSQVSGILPYLGPPTRPLHFVLVMGLPALFGLTFLWLQARHIPRPHPFEAPVIVLVAAVAAVPLILWLILASTWGVATQQSDGLPAMLAVRTVTVLPVLALAGLAGYIALHRAARAGNATDTTGIFPLLLLAGAFYLLAGAELYHLADFFGNRMNTVFKVYYQAWLLLGIVGAYGFYRWFAEIKTLHRKGKLTRAAWTGGLVVLLVFALYYPAGATLDRTGLFKEGSSFQDNTLDGLAYVKAQSPAEYAAIAWLRDEATPGNLVEAVGDDYSEYGRISAATGRPAVMGWKGHEHQWRGTTQLFSGREEDVARIYQAADPDVVRQLLDQYDVRYVYLGHRERTKYGIDRLPAAEGLLETAFARDDVVIYGKFAGP
jgi:YYY domain-containing protein